jgi:hypothetical protein
MATNEVIFKMDAALSIILQGHNNLHEWVKNEGYRAEYLDKHQEWWIEKNGKFTIVENTDEIITFLSHEFERSNFK